MQINLLYYCIGGLKQMQEQKRNKFELCAGMARVPGRSASDAAGVLPDIWCWASATGIYVQSLGLPVWLPPLMGTVVYGGSLEFVLASLLLGGFAPVVGLSDGADDPGAAIFFTA